MLYDVREGHYGLEIYSTDEWGWSLSLAVQMLVAESRGDWV